MFTRRENETEKNLLFFSVYAYKIVYIYQLPVNFLYITIIL